MWPATPPWCCLRTTPLNRMYPNCTQCCRRDRSRSNSKQAEAPSNTLAWPRPRQRLPNRWPNSQPKPKEVVDAWATWSSPSVLNTILPYHRSGIIPPTTSVFLTVLHLNTVDLCWMWRESHTQAPAKPLQDNQKLSKKIERPKRPLWRHKFSSYRRFHHGADDAGFTYDEYMVRYLAAVPDG
jgi:hypothetical protein